MIISNKIKYILALCGLVFSGGMLLGQDFIMNPTPVNSCSGSFFDSGGSFNRYSNNENIIKTICPAGGSGTHIQLQFLTTDFGAGDNLCIYDGTTVLAPRLLCTEDDQSDQANGAFLVSASAPNTSGCLTMQFTSDGGGTGAGWEAIINCVPACQRVVAELVSTDPAVVPQDNGWIDICPGESVNFVARGDYPQNGFNYFQSDASSVFSWDFGDGTIGFGPNVTHTYQRSGGYTVQVVIEDNQGCTNNNVISQRVRVATKPSFTYDGEFPDQVCANDTLVFLNNINEANSFIGVNPNEGKFDVTSGVVDSIPLPDGVNIAYRSSVTLSEYIPGAIITNGNTQIESICINIEHSYLRDLDISIECPSGIIMRLDSTNVDFSLEAYLGIPYEADDDIPGNTDDPIPGIGFTYCFTPTPQYGTFYDQALSQPPKSSLPEGTYRPIEPFSRLNSCPVNGEWTLIVEDKIKQDNGWLFSWSINFAEELRPEVETFTPAITDWGWVQNETMIFNDQDSMVSVPGSAGTINYIFEVTDDYGCTFDTTISYSVLSPTDPQCFFCDEIVGDAPDVGICEGDDVQLEVEYLGFDENTIPFENNTPTEFGNATHPPSDPLESTIAVAGASPNTITNTNTDIASVCIDIDTDATGDLQIYLTAPTGEVLELTTNNGGTGDNFRNTCFRPNAALPMIINGVAPFAGDYRPEGNWSSLLNAQINGKWTLSLSDAFGPLDKNSLNSWSISFNAENIIEYGWTPSLGLSCTDCADPVASPAATTEYIARISDGFGCVGFDTIVVNVVPDLEAPVIQINDAPGVLIFEWDAIPNANSYEVNVNNMGWFPPNNGTLSHFVSGLSEGDPVDFQVRGVTDIGSCVREIAQVNVIFGECFMTVMPNTVRDISCFGADDAVIAANVQNSTPPVEYTLDGTTVQDVSVFQNVGPGPHTIVVEDNEGCVDSVLFNLIEPSEIVVSAVGTDVTCEGGNDGMLFAAASGGVGDFDYLWTTVPTTFDSVAINQSPGNYTVQVTDANNCRVSDMATIGEPDAISIVLLGDEPSCNGGTDGSILSTVTGGTQPYAYEWSNMEFTPNITVGAGEYILTIRDANQCEATRSIQITEPAPGSATAMGMDASCHNSEDGSATIDLVGTGPFSFAWDDAMMQTTRTASNLSPGVYNFTLTDAAGCNAVGFVGIGAPAEVTASTSSSRTSCFGGSDGTANVTVVGGVMPYSFLWNDAMAQTTQVATGLLAGDYEVVITDGRMCTATRSVTVSSASEIMTTMDSTFASCIENADGSASVFPIGGTGNYTYEWNDPASQLTSLADNLLVGIYTVTVTDDNMCSVTDMVEVIAGDPVRIDSIVANMPTCFGDNDGSLVGFISGGEAPYTYLWSDLNMQFLNPANSLLAGNYTLTVTDVNGCTDTRDVILNEPDLLEITLNAQQIDCFGADNGIITAVVAGGTYPYRYTIDGMAVNDSIIENLGVGNYTIEVTDINNCAATEMISINQPMMALEFEAIQIDTSCFGTNMNAVEVMVTGGTGPNYTYTWSDPSLPNSGNINNLTADTFYLTVTDENFCTVEDTVFIVEYDLIDVNTITRQPSCFGFGDGFIGVNTVDGGAGGSVIDNYSYAWEGFPDETTENLINVFGGQSYTVTVTDSQGCTGISTDSVGQPVQLMLDINKGNISCFGVEDGFVEITSVNAEVASYEWSTSPDDQGNRIENLSEGNYLVTVTDVNGCPVVASVNLNEPSELIGSLEVTNNVCSGDSDGLILPVVSGGTVPYEFAWSNGRTTPFISNLPDGDYTVTITDQNGCSLIISATLVAPAAIIVDADVVNITCFEGSDGMYTLNASGGQGPYKFSRDGEIYNSNNIRAGLETGPYPVFIKDSQGCTWDSIIQIGTVPQFELFAGEDQFIPIGDSATLDVVLFNAVGTPEIIWSSATDFDLSCDECNSTTVSPLFTATYEAYGIDSNGCESNDFVTVFVQKIAEIMVPTGFTPNGDNNNDMLLVHGKSKNINQINTFRIYDRWGETVYENNNFNINDESVGWDGTFRNEEMESGVYVWILEVQFEDGTTDNFQGSTTLIR